MGHLNERSIVGVSQYSPSRSNLARLLMIRYMNLRPFAENNIPVDRIREQIVAFVDLIHPLFSRLLYRDRWRLQEVHFV